MADVYVATAKIQASDILGWPTSSALLALVGRWHISPWDLCAQRHDKPGARLAGLGSRG